jgi:hypothetical protein
MTNDDARFYVTHATKGNLLWLPGGVPRYFDTAGEAGDALIGHFGSVEAAHASGYFVAEFEEAPRCR